MMLGKNGHLLGARKNNSPRADSLPALIQPVQDR
jgi:hypothetical protein